MREQNRGRVWLCAWLVAVLLPFAGCTTGAGQAAAGMRQWLAGAGEAEVLWETETTAYAARVSRKGEETVLAFTAPASMQGVRYVSMREGAYAVRGGAVGEIRTQDCLPLAFFLSPPPEEATLTPVEGGGYLWCYTGEGVTYWVTLTAEGRPYSVEAQGRLQGRLTIREAVA